QLAVGSWQLADNTAYCLLLTAYCLLPTAYWQRPRSPIVSGRGAPARQGSRRIHPQIQCHFPAAVLVGLDRPLRQNDRALMHQFEATLRLADRLNRKRADTAASRQR